MNEKTNQQAQGTQILKHLRSGKRITALDALTNYDCFRLSARIHDLRSDGWHIATHYLVTHSRKRIAVYKMDIRDQLTLF